MRTLLGAFGRLLLVALALVLLTPVLNVEATCCGKPVAGAYEPILPEGDRRPKSRTLMTYPEWHIVHAYDDYAATIREGGPHDYRFLRAIREFWSSACTVSREAAAHGGADWPTRQMIHVIGVSFTAELLLKAAHEETLGHTATWVRGPGRTPLDDLSAAQAAAYAGFLHQTPWYRWDFADAAAALDAAATEAFCDRARNLSRGVEYGVKARYARMIGTAVAATGFDELTMRSIVAGLPPEALEAVEGVTVISARPEGTVISARPEGVEIETPRYEAFNDLARDLAARGATFVEIAGNDEIMLTAITDGPEPLEGALLVLPRQGNPGWRQLLLIPVAGLAAALTDPAPVVEHVHDY